MTEFVIGFIGFLIVMYLFVGVNCVLETMLRLFHGRRDKVVLTPFGWFCLIVFFPFTVFMGVVFLFAWVLHILSNIELTKKRGE